jgi:uncharacterized delta-60 repeat protein
MTTTYKLLKQYFLERDDSQTTTTGSGYYYGSGGGESTTTDNDLFNNRFNSIEVDERFNNVDIGVIGSGFVSINTTMQELENNKILIFGNFNSLNGSGSVQRIAILNEDGSLDNSFTADIMNDSVFDVKQLSNGQFIVGGNFTTVGGTSNNRLVKLNENGSDYGPDFTPNFNEFVWSLEIDKDQNIIVGGQFTTVGGVTRNHVAKINSYNGELDSSFNPNVNDDVYKVALQPDGKILIGGTFDGVSGIGRNRIARLNSDGTLDESFRPTNSSDSIGIINHIVVRPDGKIIVSGSFTSFGGYARKNIVLINNDGTVDESFNLFPRPTTEDYFIITSVSLQKDNKIVLSGFLEIDGDTNRNHLRLNEDGSLDTSFVVKGSFYGKSTVLKNGNILISGDPAGSYSGINNGTFVDGILYSSEIIKLKEKIDVAPYKLIYTVPSSTNVILSSIFSTNHNDFPVFYDIAVVPYEDSIISEKHYYIWDNLLEDNNFEVLRDKLTLSAGDKVYVYSSTDENISFNIFGTEITA